MVCCVFCSKRSIWGRPKTARVGCCSLSLLCSVAPPKWPPCTTATAVLWCVLALLIQSCAGCRAAKFVVTTTCQGEHWPGTPPDGWIEPSHWLTTPEANAPASDPAWLTTWTTKGKIPIHHLTTLPWVNRYQVSSLYHGN